MSESESPAPEASATPATDPAPAARQAGAVSRRAMLTAGAVAAAAGVASGARAQETPKAPAILTGAVAGMPFRAFVRQGDDRGIADLKLREMKPGQALVRTTASCICYTICDEVLGARAPAKPLIPNHSGFGVVEAVGSQVRRVRVGDRVVVSGSSYCGRCYACLSGGYERCAYLNVPNDPVAELADGTDAVESARLGGLSELMVAYEEYLVPLFTDLPDDQLAMMGDTAAVGIGATSVYDPVQLGQSVVIFGAGPVGLAAVQGARAQGAGQIIVVEPIAYRREKAKQFGATAVLDPNVDTDGLVRRIQDMTRGPVDRYDSGGRGSDVGWMSVSGGDLVVEASGKDWFPPKTERGPDPTGLLALRQAWEVTTPGGSLVTLAIQDGNVALPGSVFSLSGRRCYAGQMAGMNVMRDTPRFVKAMEAGRVDVGAIITARFPLEQALEAVQKVCDRTELGVVLTFA